MKRLRNLVLTGLLILGLAVLTRPSPAAASYFWLGVVDELGDPITSGVTCQVYTADTVNTAPTIYSDAALTTAKTNPITGSSIGQCTWYGSATSYDVIVYHLRGIARLQAVTVTDHRVQVDRMQPYKHAVFSFSQNAAETSSGIALPEGAMIVDAAVEVTTAVQGATVNVGLLSTETAGDTDGFVAGYAATPTGFGRPGATYTRGGLMDYLSANTRGVLLSYSATGENNPASPGYYVERPHIIASGQAKTLSYYTSAHAVAGRIHIFYVELANR